MKDPNEVGLYRKEFEHDACGIGFIASLKGIKSHRIVTDSIKMLIRMDHRGACGCDPNSGDGATSPITSSIKYFRDEYIAHLTTGGCPFDPVKSTLFSGANA